MAAKDVEFRDRVARLKIKVLRSKLRLARGAAKAPVISTPSQFRPGNPPYYGNQHQRNVVSPAAATSGESMAEVMQISMMMQRNAEAQQRHLLELIAAEKQAQTTEQEEFESDMVAALHSVSDDYSEVGSTFLERQIVKQNERLGEILEEVVLGREEGLMYEHSERVEGGSPLRQGLNRTRSKRLGRFASTRSLNKNANDPSSGSPLKSDVGKEASEKAITDMKKAKKEEENAMRKMIKEEFASEYVLFTKR